MKTYLLFGLILGFSALFCGCASVVVPTKQVLRQHDLKTVYVYPHHQQPLQPFEKVSRIQCRPMCFTEKAYADWPNWFLEVLKIDGKSTQVHFKEAATMLPLYISRLWVTQGMRGLIELGTYEQFPEFCEVFPGEHTFFGHFFLCHGNSYVQCFSPAADDNRVRIKNSTIHGFSVSLTTKPAAWYDIEAGFEMIKYDKTGEDVQWKIKRLDVIEYLDGNRTIVAAKKDFLFYDSDGNLQPQTSF